MWPNFLTLWVAYQNVLMARRCQPGFKSCGELSTALVPPEMWIWEWHLGHLLAIWTVLLQSDTQALPWCDTNKSTWRNNPSWHFVETPWAILRCCPASPLCATGQPELGGEIKHSNKAAVRAENSWDGVRVTQRVVWNPTVLCQIFVWLCVITDCLNLQQQESVSCYQLWANECNGLLWSPRYHRIGQTQTLQK